ncbi:MAG: hypothetical protein RMJ84_00945 [Sandaracinaceae bacterium]|nr:hypothetical protein [Sandaracinaceae bacterium]
MGGLLRLLAKNGDGGLPEARFLDERQWSNERDSKSQYVLDERAKPGKTKGDVLERTR